MKVMGVMVAGIAIALWTASTASGVVCIGTCPGIAQRLTSCMVEQPNDATCAVTCGSGSVLTPSTTGCSTHCTFHEHETTECKVILDLDADTCTAGCSWK